MAVEWRPYDKFALEPFETHGQNDLRVGWTMRVSEHGKAVLEEHKEGDPAAGGHAVGDVIFGQFSIDHSGQGYPTGHTNTGRGIDRFRVTCTTTTVKLVRDGVHHEISGLSLVQPGIFRWKQEGGRVLSDLVVPSITDDLEVSTTALPDCFPNSRNFDSPRGFGPEWVHFMFEHAGDATPRLAAAAPPSALHELAAAGGHGGDEQLAGRAVELLSPKSRAMETFLLGSGFTAEWLAGATEPDLAELFVGPRRRPRAQLNKHQRHTHDSLC